MRGFAAETKRIAAAAAVAAAALATAAAPSQGQSVTRESARPERVIVVLRSATDPAAVAALHGRRYEAQVEHVYGAALSGYAATVPAARLGALAVDENVAYVEPDSQMTTMQALPWGVQRVGADLSSTRAGDGAGAVTNVNAYVIDTGIDSAHADLLVVKHVNYAGDRKNTDCHGHGTHVAGSLGARDDAAGVVGAAPGIRLTGVKVFGCTGSGSTSAVIKGIDWVTANAVAPAVVNMSLGGAASRSIDDAVRKSVAKGLLYVVAAGNDGANACNYSPARAGAGTDNGIVTVAATDSLDAEASWSNYGSCVDLWAPGVSILSTKLGGGTATMSGTSMASPHVTGGGALRLSKAAGEAPANVEAVLKAAAQAPGTKSKDGRALLREWIAGF